MEEVPSPGPNDVGMVVPTPPIQEIEKNPEQVLREAVYKKVIADYRAKKR